MESPSLLYMCHRSFSVSACTSFLKHFSTLDALVLARNLMATDVSGVIYIMKNSTILIPILVYREYVRIALKLRAGVYVMCGKTKKFLLNNFSRKTWT